MHSSVDGCLGCFHSLSIINNTAIMYNNLLLYKFLCGHMFSVLLGMYLEMELLGHTITPCRAF